MSFAKRLCYVDRMHKINKLGLKRSSPHLFTGQCLAKPIL